MLKGSMGALACAVLCGCSVLGGPKAGELEAPLALNKQVVDRAATPFASYQLMIVQADVASRTRIPDLKTVFESNMAYLVDHAASVIGSPIRVCRDRARCPGRAAVVRFVEDGYQPYATQPAMMGARLEGFLVVTDAVDGRLLASYRIHPSNDYTGVFTQMRGALGAALVAGARLEDEALERSIYSVNRIPAIKPDFEPILLVGRAPTYSWSHEG